MAEPTVLGRYELHASIAKGGMASIHLGRVRGAAGFERTVAIKRLHPQFAGDSRFVAMFMDEARLVARIRHPNVVPILDVVAEEDELFLVMEYVHGESLAHLVLPSGGFEGVAVPPAIAAAIFVDVLHGLHAAHEAVTAAGEPLGIVHRDVTPHNVLVGVDGASRIADFGIATATHRVQKTQAGQLKGKLSYVAPEQLAGKDVDRRTDVYAAAVSLWEALAGRVLFVGDHEARIIERVLVGVTQAPSALSPAVPTALDDVVMRGLSMRPEKRFPTARDMALALEKAVALPPASEVGAFVAARAKDKLAQRAEAILALDRAPEATTGPVRRATSAPGVPLRADGSDGAAPGSEANAQPSVVATEPLQLPLVQNGSPAPPPGHGADAPRLSGPPPPRGRRRGAAWPLVAGVIAAAAIVAGVVLWARARAHAAPTRNEPAELAPWTEPSPSSFEPTAAPSPPSAAAPRGAAPLGAPPPPRARPGHSAADACKPPYTRDSEGRKIYKRECL